MPEGPSIVILKEEAAGFRGRIIKEVAGNSRLDLTRMRGERVTALCSWGKHFLICFPGFAMRVHFMLFGSYRVNERRDNAAPRMSLQFARGQELNFYACSLRYIEGNLDDVYDWSADVMADAWDPAKARRKLRAQPNVIAADALLDQNVFSGVGNIIKNEVLHRIRLHPESTIGALSPRKLGELVTQAREYSFDFLRWKKAYVLKKHYQVHTKTHCPRDGERLTYRAKLGTRQRRAFFCERCQKLYRS
ncbi:DNA-formamidopyrimidine glycosylase family protein [Lysobacter sp.]|uniref:DNA-formamidopyrimidine glycosylase family protein n=1 Tax=Lysobacter sp. TaxID=72226 RepID=UPI002D59CD86|nr:DNA-formamidopyrimidine glycosylase family protein [Lysobacter sp.]HZX79191.1 DNA-formamidopyrimidine glycosylase family protein [Lysobacter sp.]